MWVEGVVDYVRPPWRLFAGDLDDARIAAR